MNFNVMCTLTERPDKRMNNALTNIGNEQNRMLRML